MTYSRNTCLAIPVKINILQINGEKKRSQLTWAKDETDVQPRTSEARKTLSKHKLKHGEISLDSPKAKPDCNHYAKI